MYLMRVEPRDESKRLINRRMFSNKARELIPTAIEICKVEYNMVNPVALYIGHDVWRIFDIDNPYDYARVIIVKNAN